MEQTAVEFLVEKIKPLYIGNFEMTFLNEIEQAKEIEKQQQGYSEEDMEIVEISSSDANYIQHYQTKEGQLLATKFNVKQFKNK